MECMSSWLPTLSVDESPKNRLSPGKRMREAVPADRLSVIEKRCQTAIDVPFSSRR
jgi:hypothetical protein